MMNLAAPMCIVWGIAVLVALFAGASETTLAVCVILSNMWLAVLLLVGARTT